MTLTRRAVLKLLRALHRVCPESTYTAKPCQQHDCKHRLWTTRDGFQTECNLRRGLAKLSAQPGSRLKPVGGTP